MAGSSSNNEEQSSGQDNDQLEVALVLKPECPGKMDLRSLPNPMAQEIYKELNEDDKYIAVAKYLAPIINYGEDWVKSLSIQNYREPHKTPAQRLVEEMNCKGGDVHVLLRVLSDLNMLGALNVICQPVKFQIIRHPDDAFGKRKKINVHHGDTTSLKCEAFGLPPPRYQWYLNGKALLGQTKGILTITLTKTSQVGAYQCVVRQVDQHGDSTHEERSRELEIDMSPISVRVTEQPPPSVCVQAGGTLRISCGATGYPVNLLFQWYRNNELVYSHYSDEVVAQESNSDDDNDEPKAWNHSRSVLQIDNCPIECSAIYTCRVSNSFSDEHSCQTHVWVSSPLPIIRGKVALVIANQQYKYHTHLATAKADAKLVAMALERIGFTVMVFEDLTRKQMIQAVEIFGSYLTNGCYGFLYYVGHGYRIQENYILPIDAPEYFDHSHDISENTLLSHTLVGNPSLLVNVLDMCQDSIDPKDNPELYRETPLINWSKGVGIRWNLLQAYSTSYYCPAFEDTESDNGIYASSLASLLPLADTPVNQLFEKLGQKVDLAMRGKLHYQIPVYSTSVTQPFKLVDLPNPSNVCVLINELSKSLSFPADLVVDLPFAPVPASGRAHIKLHMDIFQNSIVVQLKDLVEPWDKASIVNARDGSTRDIARVLNDNTWYINNPRGALLVKLISGKTNVTTAVLDVLVHLPRIILDLNVISPDEMIVPFPKVITPEPPPAPHTIAPPTRENGCAIWAIARTPNPMPAPDHLTHSAEENVTNGASSQEASNRLPELELSNGSSEEEQDDNASLGEVSTPPPSPENVKRVQKEDKSRPIYIISKNYLVLTPSNDAPILSESNAGSVEQVQQLPANSTDKTEKLPELNGSTTEITNRSNVYQNFTPICDPRISSQKNARSVDQVTQLPTNSTDRPEQLPKLNGSTTEITNRSNVYQNFTPICDPRISSQNDARSVQQLPKNSNDKPEILKKLKKSAPEIKNESATEMANVSNAYQNFTPICDPRISSQNDARSVQQLSTNSSDKPEILPKLNESGPKMTSGSAPKLTNGSAPKMTNGHQNCTPSCDPKISSQNNARSVDQAHKSSQNLNGRPTQLLGLYESPQVTTLPPRSVPRTLPSNNTRSVNQTLQIPQNPNGMPSRSPTLNRSPQATTLSSSSQPLALPLNNTGSVIQPQKTPPNPNDMRNESQRLAETSPIIVKRIWSGGSVTVTPTGTPVPSPIESPMTPINIFTSNLVKLNLTPSQPSTQNAMIEQTPSPITEMTPVFVNRMSGGSVTVSPVETPTQESKSIALSTSSDLPTSPSKDTESVDQAKKSPQNSTLSPKNAESVDQTEKSPQTSTDTPKRPSIFGKVVRKVSWGSDSTPKNTESVDQTKKSPKNSIDTPKRSSKFGKLVKKVSRGSDSTPKNTKSVDKVKKSPEKSIDTSNGSPGLNGSAPAKRSPSSDL